MGPEEARAEFLVGLIRRYAGSGSSILEVGCRSGKNLASLLDAGFEDLCGVEEDSRRVALLRETLTGLENERVVNAPVLEAVSGFPGSRFDVVLTIGYFDGALEQYGPLFTEMVRVSRSYLVVIEDERPDRAGGGPVDFREVFEPLGLTEVERQELIGMAGLESVFTARVFEKA